MEQNPVKKKRICYLQNNARTYQSLKKLMLHTFNGKGLQEASEPPRGVPVPLFH